MASSTPSRSPAEKRPVDLENGHGAIDQGKDKKRIRFWKKSDNEGSQNYSSSISDNGDVKKRPSKWTMGMMNDPETDEVPGKISQTLEFMISY